jgi:hypothetical protein
MQDWFESDQTKGIPGLMKIEKENIVEFRAIVPKTTTIFKRLEINTKYLRHSRDSSSC